jgi:predicted small secreted protein
MAALTSSISSFKKFLFKILLPFLGIGIAAGLLFQLIIERGIILHFQTLGPYKINRIIQQNFKDEIPIFGSSRAEQSYVPSILGPHHFNYGISGIQDNVLLFFVQEECKKNKDTPIILNFDLDGLNENKAEITNYLYNADYPPIRKILGKDDKPIFRVPFFKYFGYYDYYLMKALYERFPI